ncbi:MAG: hypothetical protein HY343_11920 [Lentisphaerae bacterium]|nr:hypothetical protein [Lentisphaerota bacterium]
MNVIKRYRELKSPSPHLAVSPFRSLLNPETPARSAARSASHSAAGG